MRLENKTALITGASRNIGREIALTFAREGADLVLNTRASQQELEEVAAQCRELGVKTNTVLGDLSDSGRVSAMVGEGTVEDIANACLFFASDASAYITGDRLNVMGGRYIY